MLFARARFISRRSDARAAEGLKFSVLTNQSMNAVFDFEVARPGGVFHRYKNAPYLVNPVRDDALVIGGHVNQKQPADASADVSKRLDALDAQLKHLVQAIEELSKVTREKK